MNKMIMGIAALVLITASARAEMNDAQATNAARLAAAFRANEEKYGLKKSPQAIKVYVYSMPVGGPVITPPKPQAAPAPRPKPAPRTQAVKLEER